MCSINKPNFGNVEFASSSSNNDNKKQRLVEILQDTKIKTDQLEEIKKNYTQILQLKDEKINSLTDKLKNIS